MGTSGMFVTVLAGAVLARRDTKYPAEPSTEMALVCEAGLRSDRGNGLTASEQLARPIEPPREPEGMRRHTPAPSEHAGKALSAHSLPRRDLSDGFVASGANGRAGTRRRVGLSVFADHGNEVAPSNLI